VNVPSMSLRNALDNRPVASPVRPLLDAYPMPNGPELPGGLAELTERFPALTRSDTVSLRLDANLSSDHRLFVRGNQGDSTGDSLSDSFRPAYAYTSTESTSTTTATLGLSSAWSSIVHDLRISSAIHRGSLDTSPSPHGNAQPLETSQLIAPGLRVENAWITLAMPGDGGIVQSGRFAASSNDQFQIVDTWSLLRGDHEWRVGFEYQRVTAHTNPASYRYSYRFFGASDLAQGQVRFVTIENQLPARARREAWSLFVNDTFRVTRRLTLSYGLRYGVKPAPFSRTDLEPFLFDFDTLSLDKSDKPTPRGGPLWDTSWTDVAPRVNATYQLGNTVGWETILRTGWGFTFDERSSPSATAFGGGHPYASAHSLPMTSFPVPPENLFVVDTAPLSDDDSSVYFSFPKGLRAPRTHEWQMAIDQGLGRSQQLNLAYVGAAGRDLIYWHSYDLGLPVIQAFSNDARSDYHALLVEHVLRRARGFQSRFSYTWSHAVDNDSGEFRRPYAPPEVFSPDKNRASADFDRRHILRLTGSYQIPVPRLPGWIRTLCADWSVDAIVTAQSGTPVSVGAPRTFSFGNYIVRPDPVSSVPLWLDDGESPGGRRINAAAFVGVGASEVRQGTIGRNTIRASTLRQIDLSVSRSVRFGQRIVAHFRFDAFNVANTPNFGPPSGLFGSSSFGVPDRSFAEALGTGTLRLGGLIPIQQLGGARSLQLSLRLSY
jgi:hypothetical protein